MFTKYPNSPLHKYYIQEIRITQKQKSTNPLHNYREFKDSLSHFNLYGDNRDDDRLKNWKEVTKVYGPKQELVLTNYLTALSEDTSNINYYTEGKFT